MRVLVTGGSGYLGSELIRTLKAGGHVPTNFDIANDPLDDIRDFARIHQALFSVDVAYHLAFPLTQHAEEPPYWYWDHICNGTRNIVDACQIEDLRLIYVFIRYVDEEKRCPQCGGYPSPSTQAKKEAERMVQSIPNSLIVRLPNVYSLDGRDTNMGRLVPRLHRMAKVDRVVRIYPPEDTKVELLHVQDCTKALVSLLHEPMGIVDIRGKEYTIRQIADSVAKVHSARVEVILAPPTPMPAA